MNSDKTPLTYKDAGVDIEAGNELVDNIKHIASSTRRPEVLAGLGGFGALCEIPGGYRNPVLVSGTDGVGTKLKLAMDLGIHNSIGIDLVAMCVNDLVVGGAEPLFFLDYYATGHLNIDIATQVVKGIGEGCLQSGCSLVGGETAEMPGMYEGDDYDLAGFCVGIVERDEIITGDDVIPGDVILGLASSGPHSNGYSLVRKILQLETADTSVKIDGKPLKEALLTPTRIYVKSLLRLMKQIEIKSMAHITGGGLPENLPRVLPDNCKAVINQSSWEWPEVFRWLQENGNVETAEMYRAFNCGVGMAIVLSAKDAEQAMALLKASGEDCWKLGEIEASETPAVEFR